LSPTPCILANTPWVSQKIKTAVSAITLLSEHKTFLLAAAGEGANVGTYTTPRLYKQAKMASKSRQTKESSYPNSPGSLGF